MGLIKVVGRRGEESNEVSGDGRRRRSAGNEWGRERRKGEK